MRHKNDKKISDGNQNDVIYLDNIINLKTLDEVMLTSPIVKLEKEIIKKIDVTIKLKAILDERIEISVFDGENNLSIQGNLVEKAINSPITEERIEEILRKTGNTPFKAKEVDLEVSDNIFIPVGVLNELRRNILENLKSIRENKRKEYIEKEYKNEEKNYLQTEGLSILVRTKEQLETCLELNVENIIVINKELMDNHLIYRISRANINHNCSYPKLLVTDYASLDKYPNNRADYFLNITNHYSLDLVSKYASVVTLSPECNLNQIKYLMESYKNKPNVEVLVYGNLELMLMKYCPLNTIINKERICKVCSNGKNYFLKDRNNKLYKLEHEKDTHSTVILNCNKTNLIDNISELKKYGVTNFRIELMNETKEEIKELIERVKKLYE